MTKAEFRRAHGTIVRMSRLITTLEGMDRQQSVAYFERMHWTLASWEMVVRRKRRGPLRLLDLPARHCHCDAKIVAACRELNTGVLHDGPRVQCST